MAIREYAVKLAVYLAVLFVSFLNSSVVAGSDELDSKGKAFLNQYCVDCHQGSEPDGQRDLESLDLSKSVFDSQLLLQEVIDQLTLKTMPPEDGEQPTAEERLEGIQKLTNRLQAMRQETQSTGGRTVLRRLNQREYRNTVRDLLGIDMTMFDPTIEFPKDLGDSFDTLGDTQVMSAHLLESYFKAAELSVGKAFEVSEKPQEQSWNFKGDFYQQAELSSGHKKAFNNRYLCLYDHPFNDKIEGGYGPISNFKQGVPVAGVYEVRVLAKAMHQDTPYSPKALKLDLGEPFRLGIRPGDTSIEDMVHRQPIQPLLAEQLVTGDEFQWYRFEVPLDRGFAPRFTFENGHHDFRGMVGRLYRYDKSKLPEKIRGAKGIFLQRIALIQHAQIPHIRISEVEIKGPIDYQWPNRSRSLLLDAASLSKERVSDRLKEFARRAFRRGVEPQEVQDLVYFWTKRRALGRSFEHAFQDTLKSILCSPEFLYFQQSESGTKSDFALAERLAYFLASTMPDEQLLKLAATGTLREESTLLAETRRLLSSKVSDAFIADFLDSWLALRSLGSMPPDEGDFWFYYAANLEVDSKQETRLFFRDMLDQNRPVAELLSAKHSFVNRDLAKLYGVVEQFPAAVAHKFRRIEFEGSAKESRGGLLGQSSIHTVSANGIDTSPVVRGVWMLENILGTPTPPPPDDVPAIDPDVRGAKSIRDLLNKHRESDTCNQCHRKIDPLGFALESFDAIGRERKFYDSRRKQRIDTSGELPGGSKFSGLGELKQLLLERQEFFARNLTTKLLTHALGRRMAPSDRAAIDGCC
ncbi:MAG: DUF1592 domain-containing protein, partial [Planctomycetota bacterium]